MESTTSRARSSAAAAPPIAGRNTPFRLAEARYRAAQARFIALPRNLELEDPTAWQREDQALTDAVQAVDQTPAGSWAEFADAFEIACDGGDSLPGEDLVFKLLADVRRLRGH